MQELGERETPRPMYAQYVDLIMMGVFWYKIWLWDFAVDLVKPTGCNNSKNSVDEHGSRGQG